MSLGLLGCQTTSQSAVDLAAIRCPDVAPKDIADMEAKVSRPKPPVTADQTAKWIDSLYVNGERKRLAGWRLIAQIRACRKQTEPST